MKALKKITMKGVGLDSKLCTSLVEKFDREIDVCRVVGQIMAAENKINRITGDPFMEFKGEFQATNLATGEIVRSRGLILPGVAEMPLVDHISGLEKGESATFVIDVTIMPTHTTAANMSKYAWGVNIKTDISENDFLTKLSESVEPPAMLDVSGILQIESKDDAPDTQAPTAEEIEKAEKASKNKKK